MRYKILILEYKGVLNSVLSFKDKEEEIDFMLNKINCQFIEPEVKLMKQFDKSHKNISLMGTGKAKCKTVRYGRQENHFSAGKCAGKSSFSELPSSKRKEIQSEFDKLVKTFIIFAAEEANGEQERRRPEKVRRMANGKQERKEETEKGRFYEECFFNIKYSK